MPKPRAPLADLADPGAFRFAEPEGPIAIPQRREADFRRWYEANRGDLAPDPDDPEHHYDWRGAYAAGVRQPVIDPGDSLPHWPSPFKFPDHPNRVINGVDTHTGLPVDPMLAAQVSPFTHPAVDPFSSMKRR
ncbi:MAG: hypothetical protein ABWY64_21885 [Tardiphaga sp.]